MTLLLEMGMGVGLLAGAWLARAGRIRTHAACQAVIVILNLTLIILTMLPSFHRQVLPKLPGRIARPYFALATTHATLGGVAELMGLYILLAAGTKLLPERFRITRFKLWMSSLLLLWWIVLFLGMATYARWYADLR
jgi:uncharacterized membrane protein YozB (DUF420 family)